MKMRLLALGLVVIMLFNMVPAIGENEYEPQMAEEYIEAVDDEEYEPQTAEEYIEAVDDEEYLPESELGIEDELLTDDGIIAYEDIASNESFLTVFSDVELSEVLEEDSAPAEDTFMDDDPEIDNDDSEAFMSDGEEASPETAGDTVSTGIEISSCFTDAIFCQYVRDNFDTDGDGYLNDSEILAVDSINVNSMGIASLEGIEFFTHLWKLECADNNLKALNLSENRVLYYLTCNDNLLTQIDISGCEDLIEINCQNNQLTTLDVSGLPRLEQLRGENNKLTTLNVAACPKLEFILASQNQLATLNVQNTPNLAYLHCEDNLLTALDVSGMSILRCIWCDRNQITTINITGCEKLYKLSCTENQLTELNLSGLSEFTELECRNNRLTSLNLSGCKKLQTVNCDQNQLTDLNVTGDVCLKKLSCGHNMLATLDIRDCPLVVEAYINGQKQPWVDDRTEYYTDNGRLLTDNKTKVIASDSISPTSVKLNKTAATLNIGDTLTLVATVMPAGAETELKWASSNTTVATVTGKGMVTAVSAGSANISVTTANGITAQCKVTVKRIKPTSVKLNKTKATLYVGMKLTLKPALSPAKATAVFSWKSSNTKVAKVSKSGVVTPVKAGKATITVTTDNKKKATCIVTVKANKKDNLTKKPTTSQIKAVKGKWTLQPKSLEFLAGGKLAVEYYVINGTGKTSSYINGLKTKVVFNGKMLAEYTVSKVTVKAAKNNYKVIKLTIPASNVKQTPFQLSKNKASKYTFFVKNGLTLYAGKKIAYKPVKVKYYTPHGYNVELRNDYSYYKNITKRIIRGG